ncbi:MAG: alpha-hydroxy-acid oxidizing protein [Treponema sp.]
MRWVQDKKATLKKLQEMRKLALMGSSISLATVSGVLSTKTNLVKYASSELGFDLVTTKSFQVVPNTGNREPIICQPEPLCFGNSVGLRNPGIDVAVKELEALRENFELPSLLNVSLSASSYEDFITLIKRVEHLADLVELNFSCPHASAGFGASIGCSLEIATEYVRKIMDAVAPSKTLIFVKLTPNVDNIGEIAKSVINAGADGIVAINTVGPSLYLEPHSNKPILQNKIGGKGGMSGAWVFERAIECVKEIRNAIGEDVPIIGMGGVSKGSDVAKMVEAGANVVGIGSAFGTIKQQNWASYIGSLRKDSLIALRHKEIEENTTDEYIIKDVRMKYEAKKIVDIEYISDDVIILKLEGKMDFRAGEFVFLWLPGVGEKPFSLCLTSPITFIIKKRGAFTEALFKKKIGDVVYIRGLYGSPLILPKTQKAILVAGGTGLALLPSLAKQLKEMNVEMVSYVGSSLPSLNYKNNIIENEVSLYGEFNLVHDDGIVGRVLNVIENNIASLNAETACYIVGPMVFMQKLASIFVSKGAKKELIYLSLEKNTMCGIGLCGECSCGNKLTCQTGTFISLEELEKMEAY